MDEYCTGNVPVTRAAAPKQFTVMVFGRSMSSAPATAAELMAIALQQPHVSRITNRTWDCVNEPQRPCPFSNRTRHSVMTFALNKMDVWLHDNFFCDVCDTARVAVELGAMDGYSATNTAFLERELNFQCLLIEGQPTNAERLMRTRRGRNIIIPEAVCDKPGGVVYSGAAGRGSVGILETLVARAKHGANYTVPCRPLSQILKISSVILSSSPRPSRVWPGRSHIDFFSLDVEGAELEVLNTMDWMVPVRVWLIEMDPQRAERNDEIRRLLASHGYAPLAGATGPAEANRPSATDEAFVHRDLLPTLDQRRAQCRRCAAEPEVFFRAPRG